MSAKSCFGLGIRLALFVLLLLAGAAPAMADPPERVARLSHIGGAVSFLPAGESDWADAIINRPLITGDQLYTYRGARAELDIGAATVRLDGLTGFSLANLDDVTTQIELTQGTLNLHVHKLYNGQTFEIDTPSLAFVVSQPGEYRVDIGSRDESTRVTVFSGSGMVYGDNNASMRVDARQSYRFSDASLREDGIRDLPRADDFDNWCVARVDRYRNSPSRRYVSEEVIGYSDLDEYGAWGNEPSYGPIWYPTHVAVDWAPYRSGHWAWIDPWGWNWVDDAPWGFAPFHYGRWARVGHRWGWIPGPRERRPVYAPALVLFVGGHNLGIGVTLGGGPIGWAPLGPRDVYMPPYRVSRGYFSNVNVSNIRNKTVINNTNITNIYNNYAAGRPTGKGNDTYSRHPDAVTVVSRDTFAHARPVEAERVKVKREHLRRAEVVHNVEVEPTRSSLMPEKARRTQGEGPPPEVGKRKVVAHAERPSKPAPFEERLKTRERGAGSPRVEGGASKEQRRSREVEKGVGSEIAPPAETKRDRRSAPRPDDAGTAVAPVPAVNQSRDVEQRKPSRVRQAPERKVEPPVQVERQPEPASPTVKPAEPAVDQGRDRDQRRPSRVQRAPERQVEPPVQVERREPKPERAIRREAPPPAAVEPPVREERRHAVPEARPQVERNEPPPDKAPPPEKRKKQEKDCAGKDANDPECAKTKGRGR